MTKPDKIEEWIGKERYTGYQVYSDFDKCKEMLREANEILICYCADTSRVYEGYDCANCQWRSKWEKELDGEQGLE